MMVEEGRGSKVQESQGPRVPKSKGPKDQDISKSHSNTSLTLKKVHLVPYVFCRYLKASRNLNADDFNMVCTY